MELARQLWLGGYAESLSALRFANAAYVQVIEAQVTNQYDRKASEGHAATKERLVDGILMCTSRAQLRVVRRMVLKLSKIVLILSIDSIPSKY